MSSRGQGAFQELQRGVVRAGAIVDGHGHAGEVVRLAQRAVEGDQRLGGHRRAQ
jgi:ribulose 1,5-bisphosphate synthetase/thiazole synthase